MKKQKLVWSVAITIVSLLTRLQRSSLKVDETKVRFFIVLQRFIPAKLFFSLTTHRFLLVFFPFDFRLQWLDLSVPVLVSVQVSFFYFLIFCIPVVIVENFLLKLLFIYFVQYNSLFFDEVLQTTSSFYCFEHFLIPIKTGNIFDELLHNANTNHFIFFIVILTVIVFFVISVIIFVEWISDPWYFPYLFCFTYLRELVDWV